MAKPKPSLTAALAQKQLYPAAITEPVSALAAKQSKLNDGRIKTSLLIERDDLAKLKALALRRRCCVNDLILEFIANGLALNGRRAAA